MLQKQIIILSKSSFIKIKKNFLIFNLKFIYNFEYKKDYYKFNPDLFQILFFIILGIKI